MNIFRKLFGRKPDPVPPPPVVKRVDDSILNRENTFWSQQIGKQVVVIRAYGEFVDVQLEDQPVINQSVWPERFT